MEQDTDGERERQTGRSLPIVGRATARQPEALTHGACPASYLGKIPPWVYLPSLAARLVELRHSLVI